MAVLKNAKHEIFAQQVASGKTAAEAYRIAGYDAESDNSVYAAASRLLSSDKIAERVEELKSRAANDIVLTRQWVLERLMRNARIAMGEEKIKVSVKDKETGLPTEVETIKYDAAAATRALELLGKVDQIGLFVERSETGKPGEFANMNYDELLESLQADVAEYGEALLLEGKKPVKGNGTQH
jgi:phage terminase small subunit